MLMQCNLILCRAENNRRIVCCKKNTRGIQRARKLYMCFVVIEKASDKFQER